MIFQKYCLHLDSDLIAQFYGKIDPMLARAPLKFENKSKSEQEELYRTCKCAQGQQKMNINK